MQEEIIFAGFGGQGVLFAGQLMAYAAMKEGKHVTWIPSYGPEMRGGTANCTVVISDDPIGSPVVRRPSVAVVFNNPSLLKYQDLVKAGGLLVVNASLVVEPPKRDEITIVNVPGTDTANDLGETRLTNVILVGAMLGIRPIVEIDTISTVLAEKLPKRKQHLLEVNFTALREGERLAQLAMAPA